MTITEMIDVLQRELTIRGDVQVELEGCYGAVSDVFEVLRDEEPEKGKKLCIWTDICTG